MLKRREKREERSGESFSGVPGLPSVEICRLYYIHARSPRRRAAAAGDSDRPQPTEATQRQLRRPPPPSTRVRSAAAPEPADTGLRRAFHVDMSHRRPSRPSAAAASGGGGGRGLVTPRGGTADTRTRDQAEGLAPCESGRGGGEGILVDAPTTTTPPWLRPGVSGALRAAAGAGGRGAGRGGGSGRRGGRRRRRWTGWSGRCPATCRRRQTELHRNDTVTMKYHYIIVIL